MVAPFVAPTPMTVPAVATDSSDTTVVGKAPYAGTVTSVTYTPDTLITGANTDSRTVSLVNRKQDGSGTTTIATLAFVSGVNAAAFDEKAITLSVTPADLVIAEGDILSWVSTAVGTGLADPGGLVNVVMSRTQTPG